MLEYLLLFTISMGAFAVPIGVGLLIVYAWGKLNETIQKWKMLKLKKDRLKPHYECKWDDKFACPNGRKCECCTVINVLNGGLK